MRMMLEAAELSTFGLVSWGKTRLENFFFGVFRCSVKFHWFSGFSCRVLHENVHVPISGLAMEFFPRAFQA